MIINELRDHNDCIIISNKINIYNNHKKSSNRYLPSIYYTLLKYICLKNPLKITTNRLLLN